VFLELTLVRALFDHGEVRIRPVGGGCASQGLKVAGWWGKSDVKVDPIAADSSCDWLKKS
jgi:hypothetical protein